MSRVQGNGFRTFLGKIFFDDFSMIFVDQHFSKKWISGGSSGQSAKLKSFVYWSSNFEVFTKNWDFDWKFPSKFQFFGKTLFSVFTIQKISSKENSDFRTSFWALFLLCCRWFFFFRKKTISGKQRPPKRVIFRQFLLIFVQVSQCQFFFVQVSQFGWLPGN